MSLLEAIRESCTPAVWSRGVQIAREGKVIADSVGADEAVLRVRMRPDTPPFTVHLWPGDEEWSCDCPTSDSIRAGVSR